MIILRNKRYSIQDRVRSTFDFGLFGAIVGGILGAAVGSLSFSLRGISKGAKIGAILGSLGFGSLGWKFSKPKTEEELKQDEELQKVAEKKKQDIEKNPLILYKSLYIDKKRLAEYKDFEKETGIKLPKEFYEILEIMDSMGSDFIKYYRSCEKYKNVESYELINLTDIIYVPCDSSILLDWYHDDHKSLGLFFDISTSDSYVTWNISNNTFGLDIMATSNRESSLKEAFRKSIIKNLDTMTRYDKDKYNYQETKVFVNKFLNKL